MASAGTLDELITNDGAVVAYIAELYEDARKGAVHARKPASARHGRLA